MNNHLKCFYDDFGNYKNLVLSTVCESKVHSRMMSIVLIDNKFYFQTDKQFLKCRDIESNHYVSLCADNFSVEGICTCVGKPTDNKIFCEAFKSAYPKSFELYTFLDNEVLYVIEPAYIKRWIYDSGQPYIEIFNIVDNRYAKQKYEVNYG
ncbi:MAG: pyridoxamine 5'-phosphate oxidase family protein [Clostridium sp.]|nr:pyridoxamine 5'-phosphate oxidase family protein [Clostridium sp.]